MFEFLKKNKDKAIDLRGMAPTNRMIDTLTRPENLELGVRAAWLSLPYFGAATLVTIMIALGAPGFLHVVSFYLIWNGTKCLTLGVVCLTRLAHRELRERQPEAASPSP